MIFKVRIPARQPEVSLEARVSADNWQEALRRALVEVSAARDLLARARIHHREDGWIVVEDPQTMRYFEIHAVDDRAATSREPEAAPEPMAKPTHKPMPGRTSAGRPESSRANVARKGGADPRVALSTAVRAEALTTRSGKGREGRGPERLPVVGLPKVHLPELPSRVPSSPADTQRILPEDLGRVRDQADHHDAGDNHNLVSPIVLVAAPAATVRPTPALPSPDPPHNSRDPDSAKPHGRLHIMERPTILIEQANIDSEPGVLVHATPTGTRQAVDPDVHPSPTPLPGSAAIDDTIAVGANLASGRSLPAVASTLLAVIRTYIPADFGVILVADDRGRHLKICAGFSLPRRLKSRRFRVGDGVGGFACEFESALRVDDLDTRPDLIGDLEEAFGSIRGVLAAPIRGYHGTSLGAVELLRTSHTGFNAKEQALLEALCCEQARQISD